MNDYSLNMRENGKYYASVYLKADDKDQAIKQANEIMNRFPEPRFTAELVEATKTSIKAVCYFN